MKKSNYNSKKQFCKNYQKNCSEILKSQKLIKLDFEEQNKNSDQKIDFSVFKKQKQNIYTNKIDLVNLILGDESDIKFTREQLLVLISVIDRNTRELLVFDTIIDEFIAETGLRKTV